MAARIRERISHTSLRTRLVLGLLALAAVGLLVLDLVSYTALRSYLMDRVDQQVQSAPVAVGRTIVAGKVGRGARPGFPGGLPVPRDIGAGATTEVQGPPGASGEIVGRHGKVIGHTPTFGGARPKFPANPPLSTSPDKPEIFTVPSKLAEAIHWPSGLKAKPMTQLVWPRKTWVSVPGPSQTLTVLSVLPQASRRRSGPNATHWAAPAGSGRSWTRFQVRVSQTLMVRSQLAEASSSPSRLNATL